jgi:hypothetical protein
LGGCDGAENPVQLGSAEVHAAYHDPPRISKPSRFKPSDTEAL